MYDTARGGQSPGEPTVEGYNDTLVTPEAVAVAVVRRLGERTTRPVPYEWVVGRARREYDIERSTIERSVECLVREGVLRKVDADRLVVA